ncbi:MAG: YegP family protein [Saonia sp.]
MIEIKKGADNTYRFSLKTNGGNTLLQSVDFRDEKDVKKTIGNLRPLIENHSVFERKTDHNGNFLFNLKDDKGKIIGNSQLYGSEAGMENGIKNLKNCITTLTNSGKS